MANFTWTNAGGGDWSDASNWSPSISGPPGAGDNTTFNDLASSYTVTVKAGTTVGNGTAGPFISISATSALKDVAFSISGTLTADFLYGTAKNGPATSLTIEAFAEVYLDPTTTDKTHINGCFVSAVAGGTLSSTTTTTTSTTTFLGATAPPMLTN